MQETLKQVVASNDFECGGCSYFWILGDTKFKSLTKLTELEVLGKRFKFCARCLRHRDNLKRYKNFEDNPTNSLLWMVHVVRAVNFKCLACNDANKFFQLSKYPLGHLMLRQYIHNAGVYLCSHCYSHQLVNGIRWI